MNKTTFGLSAAIFVLLVVVLRRQIDIEDPASFRVSPTSALEPTVIAPNERQWIDFQEERIEDFPVDTMLQRPSDVQIESGYVYISDPGVQQILRFRMDGSFVNSIGNGRGQGPGEFLGLTDFFVLDETIWISDLNSRSVHKFSVGGELLEGLSVEGGPYRLAYHYDTLVVYAMGTSKPFTHPYRPEIDSTSFDQRQGLLPAGD